MNNCYKDLTHLENHQEEIRRLEAVANRALQNIQSIYDEIMSPKQYPDFEYESVDVDCSFDTPSVSNTSRKKSSACTTVTQPHTSNSQPKPSLPYCYKCQKDITSFGNIYISNRRKSNSSSTSFDAGELNNTSKFRIDERNTSSYERLKITIPKPFSLSEENIKRQQAKELKIAKLKEELNREIEKELKVKIASKPVPRHVRLPLYDDMVKRSEKRKKDRKEECVEIIQKATKPFELSFCKKEITKSKSMSDLCRENSELFFKAKPAPKKILDENLSKKLKDKEEIRKMLMAQRAEEMLKQSSLPFSPKHIPSSYSPFNFSNVRKNNIKAEKPDIDAITKRLYTFKCKEAMEEWNNKVLKNDLWKDDVHFSPNDSQQKKNRCKESKAQVPTKLPFYNFPVRMTTASVLREKQIREEMELRKRREEIDEVIKEETMKKKKELAKNIWPRLKSYDATIDFERDIEEKVKCYRASQKSREQEYLRELEEMMDRVSKQFLLIERQSKEPPKIVEAGASHEEEETSEKHEVDNTVSEMSDEYSEKVEPSTLEECSND